MIHKLGTRHALVDPFPVEELINLNFGDADGLRDHTVEKAFVETSSIKMLQRRRHSIIAGSIGSGKSAVFRLIKNKSYLFEEYLEKTIVVPIEESISFYNIRKFIAEYFPCQDELMVYQMIWLIQVVIHISEKLAELDGFPQGHDEKSINRFLDQTNCRGANIGLLERIAGIVRDFSAKVEARIANTPISLQASVHGAKTDTSKKLNLNKLMMHCSRAATSRNFDQILVTVDKIDKFVAGEDYQTQKQFIEALLEVEDDLVSIGNLHFNIFIRSDLFARLSFAALGRDKVSDRTLYLEWSDDEIIQFVASRILVALEDAEIATLTDMIQSTDLSHYKVSNIWNSAFFRLMPGALKRIIFEWRDMASSYRSSLITALSKGIITKVFPRRLPHCNGSGINEEILTCEFIKTHFRDGRGVTTPRYLLIFLKEVQKQVASYYDDNPHIEARVVQFGRDYEWELFNRMRVYQAYRNAKTLYIKNRCNIDDKWTKWIVQFLTKKGVKNAFSYKWIRSNVVESNDKEVTAFIAFLHSVGLLRVKEHNPQFKKRTFSLPIMYSPEPSPNPVLLSKG